VLPYETEQEKENLVSDIKTGFQKSIAASDLKEFVRTAKLLKDFQELKLDLSCADRIEFVRILLNVLLIEDLSPLDFNTICTACTLLLKYDY
jgi:hypothetical protein